MPRAQLAISAAVVHNLAGFPDATLGNHLPGDRLGRSAAEVAREGNFYTPVAGSRSGGFKARREFYGMKLASVLAGGRVRSTGFAARVDSWRSISRRRLPRPFCCRAVQPDPVRPRAPVFGQENGQSRGIDMEATDALAAKEIPANRAFVVRALLRAAPEAAELAPAVRRYLADFPPRQRGWAARKTHSSQARRR